MESRFWIELVLALAVPLTLVLIIWHRIKNEMGFGVRVLQFLTIGAVLPMAVILAMEGVLERSAISALLGAVFGYLFSAAAKETKAA